MRRRTIKNIIAAKRRIAYSLTELLIVMVIIVLIMSASLPVAKRVLDEGRVREASRQLNAYISMAKTRAVLTGRPCGVYFELANPVGTDGSPTNIPGPMTPALYSRQATRMYLAETPPPYSGSTIGSKGRIMASPIAAGVYEFNPVWYNSSAMPPGYVQEPVETAYLRQLINIDEQFLVRFDYKGPWYKCLRGGGTNMNYPDQNVFYYLGRTSTDTQPWFAPGFALASSSHPLPPGITQGTTNPGYSYQILRMPRRVGNPLELTGGTCVDMNYSGMGVTDNNTFRLASVAMAIMFSPSGGVTNIYGDGVGPVAPDGTVHFLIGRTTKVNDPWGANPAHVSTINMFDPELSNLADATALWVSVGRTNGTTTTSENVPLPNWTDYTPTGQSDYLIQARSIATGREQTGGR